MSATLAIDALNRRSLRQAMSAALAWWRTAPLPRLAELIIALEAVTPEGDRDGFSARLLGIVVAGNSVKSRSNLEALEKHAADPRLTDFLITLIGAPPFDIAPATPRCSFGPSSSCCSVSPTPACSRGGKTSTPFCRRTVAPDAGS